MEQPDLKLELRKMPREIIVVDRAAKPAENGAAVPAVVSGDMVTVSDSGAVILAER